jgi:hypothetical protein
MALAITQSNSDGSDRGRRARPKEKGPWGMPPMGASQLEHHTTPIRYVSHLFSCHLSQSIVIVSFHVGRSDTN